MSVRHLDALLEPRSVVVAGASLRAGSVGATVWRNLQSFGGTRLALNPRHRMLDGTPCHASVADLPALAAPELALICTPPASVPGLIRELGARGTRAAVVMSAGLTPAQRQAALDAARPHLLRLLGPNCIGLLNPRLGLNASFAHTDALPGRLAFVSQSGALLTAVLDWARSRRIGFSQLVSLGERADVDFGDLLDQLASDPHTRAILLYMESISAPRKFMSAARAAARNKPVIVVKAGRAGQGLQAAASHSGALAGSDLVFEAALRRAGLLRVDSLQALFGAAETLARLDPGAAAQGLTLMTNGGGAGVLAADAAGLLGLPLAPLDAGLKTRLDGLLPANWSGANPVDIIGDAPVERYTATLQALLGRPGCVLFMHAPTAIVPSAEIARACLPQLRAAPGRVLSCWLGEAAVAEARALFEQAGAADYATPEEAVQALALLGRHRANQALLNQLPGPAEAPAPDAARARALLQTAREQGRSLLDEDEAKAVLQAYGIPVVPTRRCAPSVAAALAEARVLGYPVALKIVSPELSHKSDAGGVALDLRDEAQLAAAAAAMLERLARERPRARLTGFTVQPQVSRPLAQELIVGASIDASFGPVLLFGQGGVAVEQLADRALALPPLNRALARELIERTRVSRLLAGFRNRPPADLEAICDTLLAVAQMLADLPELAELDINPLWADAEGVLALDARLRLAEPPGAGAARFAIAPYPAELAGERLWQGERLSLRPIRPEDAQRHAEFLAALTPGDLRLRFFNARRELAPSERARLIQIDYDREMAFVACDAQGRMLGVARSVADPDNEEAEFALAVRSDRQGHGLGRLLLQRLIDYQRDRGTARLIGLVLAENRRMRALCGALGFVPEDGCGGEELRFRLDLQAAAGPRAG